MKIMIVDKIETGIITKTGFGGPWMKGKKLGQMSLFRIWKEEWYEGEVTFAYKIFDSYDWIGF